MTLIIGLIIGSLITPTILFAIELTKGIEIDVDINPKWR